MEYAIGAVIGSLISFGLIGVGYYLGTKHCMKGLEEALEKDADMIKNSFSNTPMNRIKNKISSVSRKKAVYVGETTPKERDKIEREDQGWGEFNRGIKAPASATEDDD